MPRVGIQDVAQAAGCSITTVSQALNGRGRVAPRTRKRILEIQRELGYVPNLAGRNLRMNRSNMVGILFYPTCSRLFRNVFYSEVVEGLQEALSPQGYDLLLAGGDFSGANESLPGFLQQRRVDAAVLLGRFPSEVTRRFASSKVPLLMLDNDAEDLAVDSITTDGFSGGRMAVDHLWSMGHRRMLFMAYCNENYNAAARQRGFEDGLRERGLSVEGTVERQTHDDFYDVLLRRLQAPNPPTAVVCVNDTLASALMLRLRYAGVQVPDQLSFVGFDDDPQAREAIPPLTTIGIDKAALGQAGAKLLLERVQEREKPVTKMRLPVALIERDSVARLG